MVVHEITQSDFKEKVINSKKLVVVDFWATWCGPCQMMKPVFKELSSEMKDVSFGSVEVDQSPAIAQQYDVRSIPTFILFKGGNVVDDKMGGMSKDQLKDWIESNL